MMEMLDMIWSLKEVRKQVDESREEEQMTERKDKETGRRHFHRPQPSGLGLV